MNFFKLSPHRTQSGGGEGKIEASPLCPPGRRKRGRIDTNEGGRALNRRQLRRAHCSRKEVATAGSLAYTGTSVQCITLENVSSRNAINVALFQFLINRRRRQCKLHCVALSVNSCVLRRCALFYVRYYRLGASAAGEQEAEKGFWQAWRFVEHERMFFDELKSAASLHNGRAEGKETFQYTRQAGKEVFCI